MGMEGKKLSISIGKVTEQVVHITYFPMGYPNKGVSVVKELIEGCRRLIHHVIVEDIQSQLLECHGYE